MNKPVIEVSHVAKRFRDVLAVDDLSLEIYPGEIFGLLGLNGAGKTTLVEMIVGLKNPTQGSISVFGCNPRIHGDYKEKMGIQLETTHLPGRARVKEVFKLFASFYKNSMDINHLMDILKLTEKKNSYLIRLSKGMRHKVGIGLALIGNPEIIFLDEPTSGLDPLMREELWEILKQIKREGRTIFFSTHYLDEAERFCDRVGIMDKGKLVKLGKPRDLIDKIGFKQKIEVNLPKDKLDQDVMRSISGNDKIKIEYGKSKTSILTEEPYSIIKKLNEHVQEDAEIRLIKVSIDDVFFEVTGREYRNEFVH